MIYLSKRQILFLHDWAIKSFGGDYGILHENVIDLAVDAPRMTFGGAELYATLAEKAAAISFPIIHDHPFVDGNKRTGFLAAELFIGLNGGHLVSNTSEAETITLSVAAGSADKLQFVDWVSSSIVVPPPPTSD